MCILYSGRGWHFPKRAAANGQWSEHTRRAGAPRTWRLRAASPCLLKLASGPRLAASKVLVCVGFPCSSSALSFKQPSACEALLEQEVQSQASTMPEQESNAERPSDTHLPDLHGLDARFFEREYRAVPSELGKLPQAATQEAIEEAAEICTAALEVLPGSSLAAVPPILYEQHTTAVAAHAV